jgi:hypothetical protein
MISVSILAYFMTKAGTRVTRTSVSVTQCHVVRSSWLNMGYESVVCFNTAPLSIEMSLVVVVPVAATFAANVDPHEHSGAQT